MTGSRQENDDPDIPLCGSGPLERIRYVARELSGIVRAGGKPRSKDTEGPDRGSSR